MNKIPIAPVLVGRGMAGKAILRSLDIISHVDPELQLLPLRIADRGEQRAEDRCHRDDVRVDELEERYAEFPGLNLTFETREGISFGKRSVAAMSHKCCGKKALGDAPSGDSCREVIHHAQERRGAIDHA